MIERHQGILATQACMARFVEAVLQPEHRIRATKEDADKKLVHFLIEGSSMPLVEDDTVKEIGIDLELQYHEDPSSVRLVGRWRHVSHVWAIGEWKSYEDFLSWRNTF